MWTKLLLFAIAVVAVWYAFKIFSRPSKPKTTTASPSIEHTVKCAECGVYVATVNAARCGRDRCPYPPPDRSGAP